MSRHRAGQPSSSTMKATPTTSTADRDTDMKQPTKMTTWAAAAKGRPQRWIIRCSGQGQQAAEHHAVLDRVHSRRGDPVEDRPRVDGAELGVGAQSRDGEERQRC